MKPKIIARYGTYSPVYKAGEYYFISGQVGIDPVTKFAPINIADQLNQAMDNLGTALESENLDFKDVAKTTVYLTDINDFDVVNELYSLRFSNPMPARSTVGVKQLPRVAGDTPLKVEIEAVAYKKEESKV